jgi:methylglyoxal synthase
MKKLNIALVAHDGRKKELLEWVRYNQDKLKEHNLFATGTTGKKINDIVITHIEHTEEGDFSETFYPFHGKITCLLSGPLGGDQEIGAMIAEGKIDILIFFCDNLIVQGHQNDVSALTRLASLYNIAFATNRTTADMILTSSLFGNEEYKRIIPDIIENYKNRNV